MRRAGRANQLRRGAAQAHRRLPPAERHLQGAAPNAGLCHPSAGRSPPEIGPGRLRILLTSRGVTGCVLSVVRAARRAAAGVAWGRVASAGGGGLRRGGVSAAPAPHPFSPWLMLCTVWQRIFCGDADGHAQDEGAKLLRPVRPPLPSLAQHHHLPSRPYRHPALSLTLTFCFPQWRCGESAERDLASGWREGSLPWLQVGRSPRVSRQRRRHAGDRAGERPLPVRHH